MNIAYKHLDAKLRIADLTVGQWIGIILGVGLAVVWGLYLSPLGEYLTLITSIYFGAVPALAAVFASTSDFDVWLMIRAAWRWRRLDGRFASGPGDAARGYVVRGQAEEPERRSPRTRVKELELASLWEEA
jgi:hypothetical protein